MTIHRPKPLGLAILAAAYLAACGVAIAQYQQPARRQAARPTVEGALAQGGATVGGVEIRRLIGVGRQTQVPTPEYRTSIPKSSTRAEDWVQIEVEYDTAPDWLDRLTFQYHVLASMREDGQQILSYYRRTVEYLDIEKGRGHKSTVFLHPNTVKRHGMPVAVHVEILIDGRVAAQDDDLDPSVRGKLPADWWQNRLVMENPALNVRDGYLLNRKETPFAFVNIDDYEVIR